MFGFASTARQPAPVRAQAPARAQAPTAGHPGSSAALFLQRHAELFHVLKWVALALAVLALWALTASVFAWEP